MGATVQRTSPMPASAEAVFAWHARPGAFERLTPPWEHLRIDDRTGGLEEGARVSLAVRIGPLTSRWVALHRDVIPGRQFVDEQVEGPFLHWMHLHRMDPDGPARSTLTDYIEYATPFGAPGVAADLWLVRPSLERMLRYRHALLAGDLEAHARFPGRTLHVAITGASGLVGRALAAFLTTGGHRVTRLVRHRPAAGEAYWDPVREEIDAAALEGVDAVVHLAGENLADGRWTPERKRAIVASRVRGTRLLATALAGLGRRPGVLVSASAIGIYGDRGDAPLDESSTRGDDFLADLGRAWEDAAEPAEAAGIRVAHPRLGVVLSPAGGALARALLAFKAGGGARLGSGRQWMSWVSIDDVVDALHWIVLRDDLHGPVNVVAPSPVTNAEYTRTLARVLGRPALLAVPAPALRLLFGELADAALLASQRVRPSVLERSGFQFRHPTLGPALRHLLGRDPSRLRG